MSNPTFDKYKEVRGENPLILNLGCGQTNTADTYGIDCFAFANVDLVWDLTNGIPFDNNTFDEVLARDFLEHIQQGQPTIKIMEEIYRVLKVGGILTFEVPSTDGYNVGAFQDPTHISFWNQMKFLYFLSDEHGKGFRSLIGIQTWFKPQILMTYNNEHGVTYVYGKLVKEEQH